MQEYKKTASAATLTARDENERIYMEYNTKKPISQGVIEYGHFRAEVKIFGIGDIEYKIEMISPFETTQYDEKLCEPTHWGEEIKREISVLKMRSDNFEFECTRGMWRNALRA